MSGANCACDELKEAKEVDRGFGQRTDEVYRTCNLPSRFMYPRLFKGYREHDDPQPHPCYRSSSMDYGWYAPSIHTVPAYFFPRTSAFSTVLSRAGMYRNCSLNTEMDKSFT